MSLKVNLVYFDDARDGTERPEQRVVITGLFDFFDMSAKELANRATLGVTAFRASWRQLLRHRGAGDVSRARSSAR